MRSKRFEYLDQRPVNQDGYALEWPEVGFIAMNSPYDPTPSIKIENGEVVEMDGKTKDEFDMLDAFIAKYAINLDFAEEAMAKDSLEIARMLVDINVNRAECLKYTTAVHNTCIDHDLSEKYMVIGTSAIVNVELDGAVGMNSGIFNNPFMIWGKYRIDGDKALLSISFQFHHTQMDGAHAGKFLKNLQKEIEKMGEEISV